jgi:hypothetical protein
MNSKVLLASVLGGAAVTSLTGLISNTPSMMVGAVHYGFPFAWLVRLVVAPQYFPWQVNVVNLIFDVTVWSLITGIVLSVLRKK